MALSGYPFPSPAAEYLEPVLNVQQFVVLHPGATFFARAAMDLGEGIFKDDILVIDRALKPQQGNLVVMLANGELKITRLMKSTGPVQVWGVVTYLIQKT